MKRLIPYIIVAVLAISCDRIDREEDDSGAVQFSLETRNGATGAAEGVATYSIIAYEKSNKASNYSYLADGKYYSEAGEEYLIPGLPGSPSQDAAMHGSFGNVWVTCVSPAIEVNPDGSIAFDFNAQDENADAFLCSPCEEVDVSGYGKVTLKKQLVDTRSWLTFNFYGGQNDADHDVSYTIKDDKVYIKGLGDNNPVDYFPATRQIRYTSETTGRAYELTSYASSEGPPPTEDETESERRLLYTADAYVPAGFYGPKSEVEASLNLETPSDAILDGQYLTLNFSMVQTTEKAISIPLTTASNGIKELQAKYQYVYNVIVESVYFTVTVDVYDHSGGQGWENVENDGTIAPVFESWTIGSWKIGEDGNWTQVGLETQI